MLFTEKTYKTLVTELIQANKTFNLAWFASHKNRLRCNRLIQYWNNKYRETEEPKYRQAVLKLHKILKASKNRWNWEKYLAEQELDKTTKVC
jgi:hypothetical protein